MIEIWDGQSDLRHLAEAWAEEWQGEFDIEQGLRDLTSMRECVNSDILIDTVITGKIPTKTIVGAMGIQVLDMFFTKDAYSAVRYWYYLPNYRSYAREMINYAHKWSTKMNCTKMMICDNRLSVSCSGFLKAMKFTEFETVYIGDL